MGNGLSYAMSIDPHPRSIILPALRELAQAETRLPGYSVLSSSITDLPDGPEGVAKKGAPAGLRFTLGAWELRSSTRNITNTPRLR